MSPVRAVQSGITAAYSLFFGKHTAGGETMYKATTHGVTVTVMPVFIDERSDPAAGRYFWAYRVTIENNAGKLLKLISRYWRITDGNGNISEVSGDGVVGEQPELNHHEKHTYTSGCPLSTPSGFMVGTYRMRTSTGDYLDIDIPAFPLDLPDLNPVVN